MREEHCNGRLSLAHHRVISRALGQDGVLLGEAQRVVDAWAADDHGLPSPPDYVTTWAGMLRAPIADLRHVLRGKSEYGERLREASPFAFVSSAVMTPEQVRRLWRIAAGQALRILPRSEYRAYAEHLKRLDRDDRRLRFWKTQTDAWIDRYVDDIGLESTIIGHYDETLALDGAIHASVFRRGEETIAEIGVSVLPAARRRGLGFHLLDRAVLWARNHGATRLYTVCLGANRDMVALARAHNARIDRSEGEVEAVISIGPTSPASVSDELIENQIGEWDYEARCRPAMDVAGGHLGHAWGSEYDHRRLLKLGEFGDTGAITAYLIVLRYVLTLVGAGPLGHCQAFADVRRDLEPRLAHRPALLTFLSALPGHDGLSDAA